MKNLFNLVTYVCAPFLIFSSALSCLADDCQVITLHYNERPPYLKTTPQGAKGLTATPASQAFTVAEIPYKWQITPSKRQMYFLEINQGCDCLVGWFKNPEREKFAKYTMSIYQDKPQIALARADNKKLYSGMTVDKALSDPSIVLKVKSGYSYGSFLDKKIAQYKPAKEETTVENNRMLIHIHLRRADYLFIAPEEADNLIMTSGLPKTDFKYITFSNMPRGEKRYILCSEKVPDTVIKKLNTVIEKEVHKKSGDTQY